MCSKLGSSVRDKFVQKSKPLVKMFQKQFCYLFCSDHFIAGKQNHPPFIRPWSTMTRIELNPWERGRSVIKFMEHKAKGLVDNEGRIGM